MNRDLSTIGNIDKTLLLLFLCITACGLINIYGAVYTYEVEETAFFLSRFWKQLFWVGCSILIGWICLNIHSYFYDSMAQIAYVLIVILLVVTPFVAHNIKGSLSWITIGSLSLQPAELAKVITSLVVASYLGKYTNEDGHVTKFFIPTVCVLLPMLILIVMQHETGSALVFLSFALVFFRCGLSPYFLMIGIMMVICFLLSVAYSEIVSVIFITIVLGIWLAIKRKKRSVIKYVRFIVVFAGLLLFSVFSNYAFYHLLGVHQQKRVEVILGLRHDNRGVGYNADQAKIAIGSGGLIGKGFLLGTQNKLNYLPEQDTDFIFCTVGEEWGFVGASLVLTLYFLFLWRLIKIAERQKNMFSMVFIYSFTFIFLFHVTINIGMVLGLFPIIGIPLPFFSYGGSSFLCFSTMLFITLRLDIEQKNKL